MTVTATETDWLSPELQMAAVAARQILKVPGSDERRNTLLSIVGFHQGTDRGLTAFGSDAWPTRCPRNTTWSLAADRSGAQQ